MTNVRVSEGGVDALFLLYTFESTDLVEKNSINNFIKELAGGKLTFILFHISYKKKNRN